MISLWLLIIAVIFSLSNILIKKIRRQLEIMKVFLSYIILFNLGFGGLLGAYSHVFMAPETAKLIGWAPGSPFQFEIGMANLSYGLLGIIAFWRRDHFWDAVCIGWSIFLLGCFLGHIINYYTQHDNALYNIGLFVWLNDLILPISVLTMLSSIKYLKRH